MAVFDLILKGGCVVNHDGEGIRDIGVARRRHRRNRRSLAGLRRTRGRLYRSPYPARRDRQPGAFSRAGPRSQGRSRNRRPRGRDGRRHQRLRDAQYQSPTTTTPEALADKIARATNRMHCDFGFWVGGTHENAKDIPELERLPGAVGIKVFMGSSTGSLLVEDDGGVTEILKRTRRRSAFHSEDEEMLRERKPLRVEGDPRSHPVWRSPEVALKMHRAAGPHRPCDGRKDPCAAYLDEGGDGFSRPSQGTSPPSR